VNGDILIHGGRVITETHYLSPGYVLIRNGRIASLGSDWSGLEAGGLQPAEKIDAGGLIVSPGFVDMHTHGIRDTDFMASDAEGMVRGLAAYASFGVTRVCGATLANPWERIIAQVQFMRRAKEDRDYGAMLVGAHIEGPWLYAPQRGGHALEYLRVPERSEVDRLLGEVGDLITEVTFAPEVPGAVWLTETLASRGILPSIGHSEASYEQAEAVILAGARHVTHLYDAINGYRENPEEALVMMPGVETAAYRHDEVSVELNGCPVHVPVPFWGFIDRVKPRDKKVVVTDSLVGTGMPEGTVLSYKDGRQVYVEKGVLRMIDKDPKIHGNLTGSAVTMNVALRRLMQFTGLPVEEAVRWVSLNPARALGLDRETGSLKVGKWADIALFDDRLEVQRTLLRGRTVWRRT
jgi:N-acetylglucosamine-6-phosphate deacetylase